MLTKAARKNGLLVPKFLISLIPVEGKTRRYPFYPERRNYKISIHGELSGFDWDQGYESGK